MNESPYKPLALDESVPTRCECCEPARRIVTVRTGPATQLHFCPTTRAAYLPKRDRTSGRQFLIRGLYRGDIE